MIMVVMMVVVMLMEIRRHSSPSTEGFGRKVKILSGNR